MNDRNDKKDVVAIPGLAGLFDSHGCRLFRLALRMSKDREEAQDLVQETFIRVAMTESTALGNHVAEEAWLIRILVNLCRDRWRRAKVRKLAQAQLATCERNPEPAYIARIAVRRALMQIGASPRAVGVLHEIEGFSAKDISRLLNIEPVTVRWHLYRARRELARLLLETNHEESAADDPEAK